MLYTLLPSASICSFCLPCQIEVGTMLDKSKTSRPQDHRLHLINNSCCLHPLCPNAGTPDHGHSHARPFKTDTRYMYIQVQTYAVLLNFSVRYYNKLTHSFILFSLSLPISLPQYKHTLPLSYTHNTRSIDALQLLQSKTN